MDNYKNMNTEELNQFLLNRIAQLEQQGLVDHHFRVCHSLKQYSGLSFFVELIRTFIYDAHKSLTDMKEAMDQTNVNFKTMSALCIKLMGSSGCFGACRISNACSNLRRSIDNTSKEGCLNGLEVIKHEYWVLRDQLDIIFKVEQEIVSRGSQQSFIPRRFNILELMTMDPNRFSFNCFQRRSVHR